MDETRDIAKAWGRAIKAQRTQLKLSQQALADTVGAAQSQVSHWEAGSYSPSTLMQRRLVLALGIDPIALHNIYAGKAA